MSPLTKIAATVVAAGLAAAGLVATASLAQDQKAELKTAASFDGIADKAERAKALFEEAGKVIQHPRCVNCHPAGQTPLQGMTMHVHQPPVARGESDIGK